MKKINDPKVGEIWNFKSGQSDFDVLVTDISKQYTWGILIEQRTGKYELTNNSEEWTIGCDYAKKWTLIKSPKIICSICNLNNKQKGK